MKWVFLYKSFNDLPVEDSESHFHDKLALLMVDGVVDAGELFMGQAGVDSLGVYILFFLFESVIVYLEGDEAFVIAIDAVNFLEFGHYFLFCYQLCLILKLFVHIVPKPVSNITGIRFTTGFLSLLQFILCMLLHHFKMLLSPDQSGQ